MIEVLLIFVAASCIILTIGLCKVASDTDQILRKINGDYE